MSDLPNEQALTLVQNPTFFNLEDRHDLEDW